MIGHLFDIPKQLVANVVFDQSVFVKEAIKTLLHEGLIGLLLTSAMILIFSGELSRDHGGISIDPAVRAGDVRGV